MLQLSVTGKAAVRIFRSSTHIKFFDGVLVRLDTRPSRLIITSLATVGPVLVSLKRNVNRIITSELSEYNYTVSELVCSDCHVSRKQTLSHTDVCRRRDETATQWVQRCGLS